MSLEQLNQLTAYVEIIFLKATEYKPNDIKRYKRVFSLDVFKNKIKNRKPKLCPCKLPKAYVVNLGYL